MEYTGVVSHDANKDLSVWTDRLIAAWRIRKVSAAKVKLPPKTGPLTPEEIKEISNGVKQLSMGLTRERELAGAKYMDDPKLLGAYLLFYWPISYAQARSVLNELPRRPNVALDLGSGPGPMAFALSDAGAREVTAADRSVKALDLARTLAVDANEALATREWTPEKPLPIGEFDVITMGHLVNELFNGDISKRLQLVKSALDKLKPNGSLVIIEPALRETSRATLKLRDAIVNEGYAIRAPCLFQGNCPALIKETDWCHAERNWVMPTMIEQIAKAAGLHKEQLKMSYLIVAPKNEPWAGAPNGNVFRIVSESLAGKGRQRFMGCGPSGRMGISLQEKHVTDDNKLFSHLTRGDVISIEGLEAKGDGQALTEGSKVKMVAASGRGMPKE
jgi:SAM-dependent methyltransferase